MRIVFGACKTNGNDIWFSRSGFAHEIDISGLYSGDITIGHMLAYKYTWVAGMQLNVTQIFKED